MLGPVISNKPETSIPTCPKQPNHWFRSIIDTFRKYKNELFGAGDLEIRKQRMLDYTVKPSYKFILAKYTDGFYRPGCVCGRSKKKQLFMVNFYHNKKCLYVKPTDIILKHGNLLNLKVSFIQQGRQIKGRVYGNNSPANKGFPSMFYIRKKHKWYKVPFKMVFLTRKQLNWLKFNSPLPERKPKCTTIQDSDQNMNEQSEAQTLEEVAKDLEDLIDDFEMS